MVAVTIMAIFAIVGSNCLLIPLPEHATVKIANVDAIANALEIHFDEKTNSYPPLRLSWFTNNQIPVIHLPAAQVQRFRLWAQHINKAKDCEYCFRIGAQTAVMIIVTVERILVSKKVIPLLFLINFSSVLL